VTRRARAYPGRRAALAPREVRFRAFLDF